MPRTTRSGAPAPARERILTYLRQHGGRVESPDGLGLTAEMAAATGYGQVAALNAMLVRLEGEGVIKRVVRGKRTLSIALAGRRSSPKRTSATATTRSPSTGRSSRSSTMQLAAAGRPRRGAGKSVADELASLSRDIEALARKVRTLQKAVTA